MLTPGFGNEGRRGTRAARGLLLAALWLAASVYPALRAGYTFAAGEPSTAPGEKATLLELGSDACRSCKAMVVVLDAVRRRYGDRVAVVFHDVKKEPSFAAAYRVMLIPTQIFLDARGREVFRHEGYLPLEKVEETLQKMGVE